MGLYKALYGLCLKMVVEMETFCWSGSVIPPTTGEKKLPLVGGITNHSFSYYAIHFEYSVGWWGTPTKG